MTTSTPTALRSEAHPWIGSGWRAVEAQHKNATIALTHGSLQRQSVLEDIIEEVKPKLPLAAARSGNVEMIRYESVRNPEGRCLAIMTPEVFKAVREPFRHQQQNWHLFIEPPGHTVWQRSLDGDSLSSCLPGCRNGRTPPSVASRQRRLSGFCFQLRQPAIGRWHKPDA